MKLYLFKGMDEGYFLYFKGAVNSILAVMMGIMGYLEVINSLISIAGGLFFLVVSALTALKLWREHKEHIQKNKSAKN